MPQEPSIKKPKSKLGQMASQLQKVRSGPEDNSSGPPNPPWAEPAHDLRRWLAIGGSLPATMNTAFPLP